MMNIEAWEDLHEPVKDEVSRAKKTIFMMTTLQCSKWKELEQNI